MLFDAFRPVVKKGTYRFVWIFPQFGFVVKFPSISLKEFFRLLYIQRRRSWSAILEWFMEEDCVHHGTQNLLLKGINDNWREFVFYVRNYNEPFLFPTHFSFFGLFNITPLGEEIPEEVQLWSVFFSVTRGNAQSDGHHFTRNENFCAYNGYVCIRDYGGISTQEVINEHWEEFNSLQYESTFG